MSHLSDRDLVRWRDAPSEEDRAAVVEHLAACDLCAGRYAELIRTRPLEHPAPELDISDFVAAGASLAGGARLPAPAVRGRAMRWVMAAAAVLVLTALTWQTVEGLRLRARLTEVEASRIAQEQRSAEQSRAEQGRLEALNRELQDERSARTVLERELADQREPSRPDAAPRPIVSLFLTLGRVRAGGEARRLTIPGDAADVRLMLDLGERRPFRSYSVTMLNADGVRVWTRKGLQAGGQVVLASVPAKALPEDDYEVSLEGVTQTGNVERVGEYYFTVLRK